MVGRVICPPTGGIPAAPVCGCVGWHNLVIRWVLVMKARWRGMWQCDNVSAVLLQSSSLRPRPSVTAAGACYSPAVTCSHYIATHLTHNTSVYLTWDFVHWGCGGFLVHGLFNTKTLVSCPSHVTVKINNDCQNLDGKSMTLVTLPRCGLMLMWLLLTAGTFDTICPWTI